MDPPIRPSPLVSYPIRLSQPADLRHVVWQVARLSLGIGAIAAAGAALFGPIILSFLGRTYVEVGFEPLRLLVLVVFLCTFIQAY